MSSQKIQQSITNFFSGFYQVVSNALSMLCSRVQEVASRIFGRKIPSENPSKVPALNTRATHIPSGPTEPALTPEEQQIEDISKILTEVKKEGLALGEIIDALPKTITIPWGAAPITPIEVIRGNTVNGR